MKINKLKAISIAVCCLIASLWSEAQCMDGVSDFQEGTLYKIKNKFSGNVLSSIGSDLGKGTAGMQEDVGDNHKHASHRLWFVEKKEGAQYYKFRNHHSGNVLNGWGNGLGKGTAGMQEDVDDNHQFASHRFWYLEKEEGTQYYKIKHYNSGNVLNGWGNELGKETVGMQRDVDDRQQFADHRFWSFIPVYSRITY